MPIKNNIFLNYLLLLGIIFIACYILNVISLIILAGTSDLSHTLGFSLYVSLIYYFPFILITLGMFIAFRYILKRKQLGLYRFEFLPEFLSLFLSAFIMAALAFHEEMSFFIGHYPRRPDTWGELWSVIKRNNFGLPVLIICSLLFLLIHKVLIKKSGNHNEEI